MDNLIERITPSNIDAERAVLGAMLLDKEAVAKVLEILTFHHFYVPNHQIIFKVIYDLYNQNHPVDLVTVSDSLRRLSYLEDIGGYTYLLDLSESVPTTANVEQYSRIVEEKYLRREIIRITNEVNNLAYESTDEIAAILDKAEQSIFNIGQGRNSKDMVHIKELLVDNFESIADGFPDDGKVSMQTGISTGITDLDNMTNGLNPSDLIILAARPAMGKMESVDNLIVTPNGKIRMGDIKIGQKVCGSDGKNYNVTGVFPQGIKDCYRVYFDDNTYVDCGLEHLWEVTTRANRKSSKKERQFSILTTEQLMKNIYLPDGRKNYAVRITDPVYFETQELNLHPYCLGIYIGDGSNGSIGHSCSISNIEKDVINKFKNLLPESDDLIINVKDHSIIRKQRTNKPTTFYSELENLELNNKHSHEKFIPKIYLYNSVENRLELLRGLLDTDGFIPTKGRNQIEYTTTSYQLCMDILELVRSLGGKCSYQEKQGAYTKNGVKFIVKKYYRIYLSLPEQFIPVSSEKHLSKYSTEKRYHKKYIVKIEHVGKAEMQCISVTSPDHLYITEGYNLTHNTSFCLNLATNIALKEKYPIAIFSLEMSKEQITQRIVSSEAEVSNHHLRVGNVAKEMWEQITKAVGRLYNVPIYIDDSSSLSPIEIRSKLRRLKAEHKKLGAVIIDYLQLMETSGNDANRVQEIAKITRALKRLAREMDVPVIALSQLSRTVEQRQNKRPQLSDLRESGSIEQDADIVMFIYRDEYYNPDSDKKKTAELIIAKHRNGPVGTVELYFDASLTKFSGLEKYN